MVLDTVVTKRNVGWVRKSKLKIKYVLIILCTVLKYGGKWDFLGHMSKMERPKFEKPIIMVLKTVSHLFNYTYVKKTINSA